jgi:hypothetical protein
MAVDDDHGHLFLSGGDLVVVTERNGRIVKTIDGTRAPAGWRSARGVRSVAGRRGQDSPWLTGGGRCQPLMRSPSLVTVFQFLVVAATPSRRSKKELFSLVLP